MRHACKVRRCNTWEMCPGLHARKLWSAQRVHFQAVRTMVRTAPVACTRAGSELPANNGPSNGLKQHVPGDNSTQGPEDGKKRGTNNPIMSIPTVLTILRVCAIPPVVYLVQFPDPSAAAWATTVFVAASITDWLDGYLARKMVCDTLLATNCSINAYRFNLQVSALSKKHPLKLTIVRLLLCNMKRDLLMASSVAEFGIRLRGFPRPSSRQVDGLLRVGAALHENVRSGTVCHCPMGFTCISSGYYLPRSGHERIA